MSLSVYNDKVLAELFGVADSLKQGKGVVDGNVHPPMRVVDESSFESQCKECLSTDNPLVLDVENCILVCRLCGFVDPDGVQCEWDNTTQKLLLGHRRMRRKTVPYNHTYYFSEKMRCANGEGKFLVSLFVVRVSCC